MEAFLYCLTLTTPSKPLLQPLLVFFFPLLPLGSHNNLLCFFGYNFSVSEEMVVDHAASVTFSFGSLLHRIILPLFDKGRVTLLFFICHRRRMRAGWTLPIFEQILGFYHFSVHLLSPTRKELCCCFLRRS